MTLFLDSAMIGEVREAMALRFVGGVTTNPTLLARTGRPPFDVLAEICDASHGPVFYQLTGSTVSERREEASAASKVNPESVILKIPTTTENLALVSELSGEYPCAMTAIFSAGQAYLAGEAGARYIIPYVNRSSKLLGDGPALVREMAEVLAGTGVEIIAASVKSAEEAVAAIIAGAHHLTLPLDVIRALGHHDLSEAAITDFAMSAGQPTQAS